MIKSRMMQVWTKRVGRIALGGALALIAVTNGAPGTARAEDSNTGLFGSMLKSLGIGGENQIEYRERPPLVVPPTRDLPPPQASATARDPNWPVDGKTSDKSKKGTQVRDLDRLTGPQRPAEPSVAGASAPNPAMGSPDTTASIPPSQPATSSGFFGNLFSSSGDRQQQVATPTAGAPARKSLTEPPPDYEARSPSQPYGAPTPPTPKADATKAATTTPAGTSGL